MRYLLLCRRNLAIKEKVEKKEKKIKKSENDK